MAKGDLNNNMFQSIRTVHLNLREHSDPLNNSVNEVFKSNAATQKAKISKIPNIKIPQDNFGAKNLSHIMKLDAAKPYKGENPLGTDIL